MVAPRQGADTLRGSHANGTAVSYERDTVSLSERKTVTYVCQNGHTWGLVLDVEAVPPLSWTCPQCFVPGTGVIAGTATGSDGGDDPAAARSAHWEIVRARRSDEQLQQLLNEAMIRAHRARDHKE